MAEGEKLTKKQRKAADFKAAKASGSGSSSKAKAKGKKRDRQGPAADVPEEDLLAETDGEPLSRGDTAQKPTKGKKDKEEARREIRDVGSSSSSDKEPPKKKGKEGEKKIKPPKASPLADNTPTKTKAKKLSFDDAGKAMETGDDEVGAKSVTPKSKGKRRAGGDDADESAGDVASASSTPRKFIVFVGNMSFKSTSDQIASHFKSHCSETPSVRLLTTRSSAKDTLSASKLKSIAKGKAADTTIRSKGCAFLEFQTATALQKALGLHHTLFADRLINVELTAGGGGKGADRQKKIDEKNAKLEEERKKLHDKYIGPANEEKKRKGEEKRERGEDVGPPRKKLRKGEEGEAQWGKRGGGAKGGPAGTAAGPKKQPRWMASGANAVRITG